MRIFTLALTLAAVFLPALVIGQAINCQLVVPPRPLTSNGLATPYILQLNATAVGMCQANNPNSIAFVHGVILDTTTGVVSVYNPLVITQGTAAVIQPTPPTLPATNVVALWFGNNGNVLTLVNFPGTNSTGDGACVNGAPVAGVLDTFVQFAYCNAPAFFQAAKNLIVAGKMVVPPLGIASDGITCPNVRAWDAIDQDPSDNVPTAYLVDGATQNLAQFSQANVKALVQPTKLANPSDNALITNFIMPAAGCAGSVWMVPDLVDANNPTTALPLNEIQANMFALKPQAMIPLNHAFTVVNQGNPGIVTNLFPLKTNLYRVGVNQPRIKDNGNGAPLTSTAQVNGQASPKAFCFNMNQLGGPRLQGFKPKFQAFTSPSAMFNNLFDFLANRFAAANMILNCTFFTPNNIFVVQ